MSLVALTILAAEGGFCLAGAGWSGPERPPLASVCAPVDVVRGGGEDGG